MSKKKKIFIGIATSLLILLVIYGVGVFYFKSNIIPNTTLYGEKVSDFKQDKIDSVVKKQKLSVKVPDKRAFINLDLANLDYKIDDATKVKEDILKKQNIYRWPITIFAGQDYENIGLEVNDKSLLQEVKDKKVVRTKGLKESKDAYFDVDEATGKVNVVHEEIGEVLDRTQVVDELKTKLKKGTFKVDLKPAIVMPNVEAKTLEKTVNEVEHKLTSDISITVKNLNKIVKPAKKDRLKWLTINYEKNEVNVDKKAIRNYLKTVNQSYIKESKDNERIYSVKNGVSNLIQKGKSVSGLDEDALTAKIYDAVENNYALSESVNAVTISEPKVTYQGHQSIDNNLVEVSIAKQKVYLYSNGKLIRTADVVTGKPNGNTDTTKGKYTVMYKTTNFTLKGDAYGYDYKLPVSYWIPFEGGGGIGLHDAPWRSNSSFGGNLYLTSGSHGCINMRLADVKFIYETVVAGTAVWVH